MRCAGEEITFCFVGNSRLLNGLLCSDSCLVDFVMSRNELPICRSLKVEKCESKHDSSYGIDERYIFLEEVLQQESINEQNEECIHDDELTVAVIFLI